MDLKIKLDVLLINCQLGSGHELAPLFVIYV